MQMAPKAPEPRNAKLAQKDQHVDPPKKVIRRGSKPIINWFQRKLAGGKIAKRKADGHQSSLHSSVGKGRVSTTSLARERVVSSPTTAPSPVPKTHSRSESLSAARRKAISLNERDDNGGTSDAEQERRSTMSSMALESIWAPTTALEADDDASVRPIPPSTPPSPSPSQSHSSLSYPRTFRSMTASTKPTTLLSIDLASNGMAHIAQVPASHPIRPPAHTRGSSASNASALLGSAASFTFSALPPPSPQPTGGASSLHRATINSAYPNATQIGRHIVQAPLHTTHHPRNNPRPSSPPLDNASVLTLASSAFALYGTRMGAGPLRWGSATPSATAEDSTSQFERLTGQADGDEESVLLDDEREIDASMRALRPRSSRRGSWDSEVSRWSARVGQGGPGTPSWVQDRGLDTANSVRTGGNVSTDRDDEVSDDEESRQVIHVFPREVAAYINPIVKPASVKSSPEKPPSTAIIKGSENGHSRANPPAPQVDEVLTPPRSSSPESRVCIEQPVAGHDDEIGSSQLTTPTERQLGDGEQACNAESSNAGEFEGFQTAPSTPIVDV